MTQSFVAMPSSEVKRLCVDALSRIEQERQWAIQEWAAPMVQRHADSSIRKWLNKPVVTVKQLIEQHRTGGIMERMDVFAATAYRDSDEQAVLKLQSAAEHADTVNITTGDLWVLVK